LQRNSGAAIFRRLSFFPTCHVSDQQEIFGGQSVQVGIPEIDEVVRVGHNDHVGAELKTVILDKIESLDQFEAYPPMTACSLKGWVNILSAICAIAAALLWLQSARVKVWADGQTGTRQDNIVILNNGRMFDVTGTAEAQSRWSAYAAMAAAAAAALQAISVFMKD
jgi:hypothetical protein